MSADWADSGASTRGRTASPFKTALPTKCLLGDAELPPRCSRPAPARSALIAAIILAAGTSVAAQVPDTAQAIPQSTPDSLRRLKPISAFWRSVLIPGWGQAVTHRWV